MNRDRALRRAGLQVPDPLFATKIPTGRRSSCPAPLSPGDQPEPRCSSERSGVGPLRWARCPDDGRLHLLQSAQVPLAAAGNNARALCGQRIPAEGLTITNSPAGALCVICVVGIPAEIPDPGPRGTAP